jgi:N-acetylglucosaminyldiphosphoundecaprenol N-acetyl-beta-D-mannosaminyltransferase
MLKKNYVLGVGVTCDREDDILEYILWSLKSRTEKYFIVTPNPEIVVYANSHVKYKKILNEARIALPDGVGVFLASGILGHRLKERITGVDFMEEICKRSVDQPIKVGFLGGGPGVAKRAADCLKKKYPWIKVVFKGEEWRMRDIMDHRGKGQEEEEMDILFVAFGAPKQEEWIYEHLEKLPVKVAMGVGGAFDYVSGNVRRAPFMIRAVGFEWLFRLVMQSWRWRRQLALPKFVWMVLRERFGGK